MTYARAIVEPLLRIAEELERRDEGAAAALVEAPGATGVAGVRAGSRAPWAPAEPTLRTVARLEASALYPPLEWDTPLFLMARAQFEQALPYARRCPTPTCRRWSPSG